MSALYKSSNQTKGFYYWLTVFVISIPIINGLASVTTNYFPPATLNPGFVRILLLIVFVLIAYPRSFVPNSTNLFVVGFAFYWILLIPFADNLPLNVIQAPKVILSILLFPIGYYYINSTEKFILLLNSIFIAGFLFVLNFFIANIFQIGQSGYGGEDSSLYFGSGGINISKAISFILLLVPFYLKLSKNKRARQLVLFFAISALPVLLISLKRSALLAFVLGAFTYMIFTTNKGKFIKWLLSGFILFLLLSPLYIDTLNEVLTVREQSFAFDDPDFAERESRIGEIELVLQKFMEGSIKHKLFGTDVIYNNYLYGGFRMLHTDYMVLLYGTGIIGFIWFMLIYLVIVVKYNFFKINSLFYKEGKATLYALIVAAMAVSIAGSIGDLNFRSLFTLFAGGLIGTARTLYFNEKTYYSPHPREQ